MELTLASGLRVLLPLAALQVGAALIVRRHSPLSSDFVYLILDATTQGPIITGTFNARALYKALIMNRDNARQFRA